MAKDFPMLHVGVVLYPAFQVLDVASSIDPLTVLSTTPGVNLTLSVIAHTLKPCSARDAIPGPSSIKIGLSVMPTHTFDDPPRELDVLIVPGGVGQEEPLEEVAAAVAFVARTYPKLKYLMSVCTGTSILARAGVLDGRRATTNKREWHTTVAMGPRVQWVPEARWIVDGNIWTTAGVTAGLDMILTWIGEVYGEDMAEEVTNRLEYERHTDPAWDPFAAIYNVPGVKARTDQTTATPN